MTVFECRSDGPLRGMVPMETDVDVKNPPGPAVGPTEWAVWTISQDMSIVATWNGVGELDRISTRAQLASLLRLSIGLTALVDSCAREMCSDRLASWCKEGFELLFVVDEATYIRRFGVQGHTYQRAVCPLSTGNRPAYLFLIRLERLLGPSLRSDRLDRLAEAARLQSPVLSHVDQSYEFDDDGRNVSKETKVLM